ncbi:hypothetical protein IE53DRAFT_320128 [Violaceomyces palustris]|uniref:Uncharacterized protein n=1 Tax=Violaceomyces palustris TaxID=1673888 RepID=A0ACD0NQL2_9BASI|nr:hypothetical protein IE53DRAFT_320128 [Violaceomyces palustris]
METGLGLFAATSIIKGQFVCEYAGELISDREASKRWQQQIEAIVGTSDEREGGEGAIDEPSVERPKSEELESDPQAKVATVSGSTFGTSAPKGTGDNYILTLKEYTSDGDHLRTNIDPRSTGNLA